MNLDSFIKELDAYEHEKEASIIKEHLENWKIGKMTTLMFINFPRQLKNCLEMYGSKRNNLTNICIRNGQSFRGLQ